MTFQAGEGSLGFIWVNGAPGWKADLEQDRNFLRSGLAAKEGLRSTFAFPILLTGKVLGVMEFFSRKTREVDVNVLAMAATIGTQIGRFIELRRAENLLREAKDSAEAANRAKSQFLANMSHELRTPLNSVIGFSRIIQKKAKLEATHALYVERIHEGGLHLLSLIDQVLDLAKVESGKMELEPAPVSLNLLVDQVLRQCEAHINGRDLRLIAEVPPLIPALTTDGGKLKQVLLNLVGNAVKFTGNGSVTVRVATAPRTHLPQRIDVTDTGPGIPSDRISLIFKAFEQANNTTARRFGGTGLGLSISRSLCQLMGFSLTVRSEVGMGSTFSVHLTGSMDSESVSCATPESARIITSGSSHQENVGASSFTDDRQRVAYAAKRKGEWFMVNGVNGR